MNDFFKPTAWKIIIAIIIFAIISMLPIVPAVYVYKCAGCTGIEFHSFWNTIFSHALSMIIFGFAWQTMMTIIVLASELVISYIASCAIVNFFKK